jgi:23S rRNA (uracil1939-C5)-methyltransferase
LTLPGAPAGSPPLRVSIAQGPAGAKGRVDSRGRSVDLTELAVQGAEVIGLEGAAGLVARARQNALANGLVAQFDVANLFLEGQRLPRADKWLVDPPRDGALEVVKSIGEEGPQRIVYVSCDPATLARDAGLLVHSKGYALRAAGVVNMFPHTAHVESMAVFERA